MEKERADLPLQAPLAGMTDQLLSWVTRHSQIYFCLLDSFPLPELPVAEI